MTKELTYKGEPLTDAREEDIVAQTLADLEAMSDEEIKAHKREPGSLAKRMGRPRLGEGRSVLLRARLAPELASWLDYAVAASGRDRSEVVRKALAEYLRKPDQRENLATALSPSGVVAVVGTMAALAALLDASDIERLKARAEREGVGSTQLARQWILERLAEPSEIPAQVGTALQNLAQADAALAQAEVALQTLRHNLGLGTALKLEAEEVVDLVSEPDETMTGWEPLTEPAAGKGTGPRRGSGGSKT